MGISTMASIPRTLSMGLASTSGRPGRISTAVLWMAREKARACGYPPSTATVSTSTRVHTNRTRRTATAHTTGRTAPHMKDTSRTICDTTRG